MRSPFISEIVPLTTLQQRSRLPEMPNKASAFVVPSATVVTQLGLRMTYFLVFGRAWIWSSIAPSASLMFLRRLSQQRPDDFRAAGG